MKSYIDQLRTDCKRALHESKDAIRAAERRRMHDTRIHCDIPLVEQIEVLMRSLPPAQRNRPWSMDDLVARLKGRYNARPCAGEIGVALRRLGWTRSRDWSRDGGGRRVWFRE